MQTVIERYNFSEVEKWASGDKKITIEMKVDEERKKLEFETSLVCPLDFLTLTLKQFDHLQCLQTACELFSKSSLSNAVKVIFDWSRFARAGTPSREKSVARARQEN